MPLQKISNLQCLWHTWGTLGFGQRTRRKFNFNHIICTPNKLQHRRTTLHNTCWEPIRSTTLGNGNELACLEADNRRLRIRGLHIRPTDFGTGKEVSLEADRWRPTIWGLHFSPYRPRKQCTLQSGDLHLGSYSLELTTGGLTMLAQPSGEGWKRYRGPSWRTTVRTLVALA